MTEFNIVFLHGTNIAELGCKRLAAIFPTKILSQSEPLHPSNSSKPTPFRTAPQLGRKVSQSRAHATLELLPSSSLLSSQPWTF